MRFLLDTHAFIWAVSEPDRLSRTAHELIAENANELVVSACSAWEIATKHRIGKLPDAGPLLDGWADALRRLRADAVPIEHAHALHAGRYQVTHRDPFDRLLAAQAELDAIPLITKDAAFAAFPVTTIW
jgi:PIN domain nuclease of toxin-antitoxin system